MKYLLRNIAQAIITVLIIAVVVFLALHASGDPVENLISDSATAEQKQQMIEQLGLDKPLLVQFGIFIKDMLGGNLGNSYVSKRPVTEMIAEKFPYTLQLSVASIVIAFIITVIFGSIAAVYEGSVIDFIICKVCAFFQAIPIFFIAIIAIQLICVKLRLLPVSGAGTVKNLILPSLLLAMGIAGGMVMLLRNNMIDVLKSDFIKFTRLNGVSEYIVILKHALRSSVSSVLSLSALTFAHLVAGSVVVESIFSWPGIGTLSYSSILARDFPVVQGIVLIYSLFTVGLSLVVDILIALIDPRVRTKG